MQYLRQSTASQSRSIGPFVDDTDFKTVKTGLTIANTDVKLVINGAASANKNSGGGTHRVSGFYSLTFDATDSATVGEFEVVIAVASALVVKKTFWVLEEAIYDALFAASAAGFDASGRVDLGKLLGTAVSTPATAGIMDVNTIKITNTAQTARDLGASVLLSPGTGTGQVSLTSGLVDITQTAADKVWASASRTLTAFSTALAVSVWDVLASAVATASSIGLQIKTNLDVVLSTRLGTPSGASLSADLLTLLNRLTSARAGYMDNMNVGGNLASSAEVVAIQNNTSSVFTVPPFIERPDSGTTPREIHLYLYDASGNMEAPDSAPTLTLTNQAGTDRSSRLDSTTMALVNTGHYKAIYTADASDTLEQLLWEATIVEGGATRKRGGNSEIVDTTAVAFTSADRTKLGAIKDVTDLIPNGGVMSSIAQASALSTAQTAITAIKAKTDNLPTDPADASDVAAAIAGLNNLSAANVLTQVNAALDAANTEVTAVPASTASLRDMIKYPFAWRRNKKLQTSTTMTLRNNADGADIATSAISDDGTILTLGKDA